MRHRLPSTPIFLLWTLTFILSRVVPASEEIKPYCWEELRKKSPFNHTKKIVPWSSSKAPSDGQRQASPLINKKLQVESQLIAGNFAAIRSVSIHPDPMKILTIANDQSVKIWNIPSGQPELTLKGHSDAINSVLVTPNSRWILTGSNDGSAKLWNARTGQFVIDILRFKNGEIRVSDITSDSRFAVFRLSKQSERHFEVKVVDLITGKIVVEEKKSTAYINAYVTKDGNTLCVANQGENNLRFFDREKNWQVLELKGRPFQIGQTPKENWFPMAFEAHPDIMNIFGFENLIPKVTLKGVDRRSWIYFSPNGKWMAGFIRHSTKPKITLWNLETGELIKNIFDNREIFIDLEFSPDSSMLLIYEATGAAVLWDVATGVLIRELKGHSGPISDATFSPDGSYLVSVGIDRRIIIWHLKV